MLNLQLFVKILKIIQLLPGLRSPKEPAAHYFFPCLCFFFCSLPYFYSLPCLMQLPAPWSPADAGPNVTLAFDQLLPLISHCHGNDQEQRSRAKVVMNGNDQSLTKIFIFQLSSSFSCLCDPEQRRLKNFPGRPAGKRACISLYEQPFKIWPLLLTLPCTARPARLKAGRAGWQVSNCFQVL